MGQKGGATGWLILSLFLNGITAPASAGTTGDQRVPPSGPAVSFTDDVLPLLSRNCFSCHGPDSQTREADLRLDSFKDATERLPSGAYAIVPGRPEASDLYLRIIDHNSQTQMPPAGTGYPLTPAQAQIIHHWIAQGANYQAHWSFQPIRPVALPEDIGMPGEQINQWADHPIDRFVLQKMVLHGLSPSLPADPVTLIRRVSLDLTGLPPQPETITALLAEWSEQTYGQYVDHLLSSPSYGEHMASFWLDASRYADTNGYQHDNGRSMWPWRDWVIDAFNTNMPWDQFAEEQIAGDLMPGTTDSQRIATGFNRHHGLNFEGGSIGEESRCEYVIDRVSTFGTVWLGLTLGCAQCHDHKTDPISQREYYGIYAFFNTIDEEGFAGVEGNAKPLISLPWPDHDAKKSRLQNELEKLDQQLSLKLSEYDSGQQAWESAILDDTLAIAPYPANPLVAVAAEPEDLVNGYQNTGTASQSIRLIGNPTVVLNRLRPAAIQFHGGEILDCGNVADFESTDSFSVAAWVKADGMQTAPIVGRSMFHGFDIVCENGHIKVHLVQRWDVNAIFVRTHHSLVLDQWCHIAVTYDGTSKAAGVKIYIDGNAVQTEILKDDLTGSIRTDGNLFIASRNAESKERFRGEMSDIRVYPRRIAELEILQLANRVHLQDWLILPNEDRLAEMRRKLREFYLQESDREYSELLQRQISLKRELSEALAMRLTVMVMHEMDTPRDTHRLIGGRYDRPGERVTAMVPGFLPPLSTVAAPNRLSLAKWLTSPEHPLTARVVVNREWEKFFGRGIVATPEDLGVQGDRPTHPELLDYLANRFISGGWDMKRLHREMVLSATYQQSSEIEPARVSPDPDNRWLARFSRRPMRAEVIRDSNLTIAGLLDDRIGGPSVMPPQPSGLWDELSFQAGHSAQHYRESLGGDSFRRSVYTFWKRSCPPPNMTILDAGEREVCSVRRSVTNTPLQALVMMNDRCFTTPCVHLAWKIHSEYPNQSDDAIAAMFYQYHSRSPKPNEMLTLSQLYANARKHWQDSSYREFVNQQLPGQVSGTDETLLEIATLAVLAQVMLCRDASLVIN